MRVDSDTYYDQFAESLYGPPGPPLLEKEEKQTKHNRPGDHPIGGRSGGSQAEWEKGLTPEQKKVIGAWEGDSNIAMDVRGNIASDYGLSQNRMQSEYSFSNNGKERMDKLTHDFDDAMKSAPDTEANVFRGLRFDSVDAALDVFEEGRVIQENTYSSASKDYSVAGVYAVVDMSNPMGDMHEGGRVIVEFQAKTAVKLGGVSEIPTQKEHVIRPGTKFRVKSAELGTQILEDDVGDQGEYEILNVVMEEV